MRVGRPQSHRPAVIDLTSENDFGIIVPSKENNKQKQGVKNELHQSRLHPRPSDYRQPRQVLGKRAWQDRELPVGCVPYVQEREAWSLLLNQQVPCVPQWRLVQDWLAPHAPARTGQVKSVGTTGGTPSQQKTRLSASPEREGRMSRFSENYTTNRSACQVILSFDLTGGSLFGIMEA